MKRVNSDDSIRKCNDVATQMNDCSKDVETIGLNLVDNNNEPSLKIISEKMQTIAKDMKTVSEDIKKFGDKISTSTNEVNRELEEEEKSTQQV